MRHISRVSLVIAGAIALAAAAPAGTRGQALPNVLEIVVGNGPFAGTYKPPPSQVICMHAKKEKQYTAAYKDFNATGATMLSDAGINVWNPDVAGAKQGQVRVAFGDPDKKPTVYEVSGVPFTLTLSGKGADIAFQGKTKDGIQLRVTAKCLAVEQL